MKFLLAALAAAIPLHGFAQEPAATPKKGPPPLVVPEGVTIVDRVEIGTGGGRPLTAKLAYPTNPTPQPMPAVLWIHGGGWAKGTHRRNEATWLAGHGYFTASVEYRLSGEAKWPAQIEDCKLAVRWLRANAAKYHVDPRRIAVWGASAGGHLVACLGTMTDPKFEGSGGYPGVSSRPDAVIDFNGPVDFSKGSAAAVRTPPGKTDDYESKMLLALFDGGFRDKGDLWREASPLQYVKAGDPPFFILHGDADESIVYGQSLLLKAALEKAGVPVELMTIPGGGHSLMNGMVDPEGKPLPAPTVEEVRQAMLKFLECYLSNQRLSPSEGSE